MSTITALVRIAIEGRFYVDQSGAYLGEYHVPAIECEHQQMLPPKDAIEVPSMPASHRHTWDFGAQAWRDPEPDPKEVERARLSHEKAANRTAAIQKLAMLGLSENEIGALIG